jgi:hypothetical protein
MASASTLGCPASLVKIFPLKRIVSGFPCLPAASSAGIPAHIAKAPIEIFMASSPFTG